MERKTIIGIGCAGGWMVNRMVDAGRIDSEFAAINTDQRRLDECLASTKLQIGFKRMQGLGACDPSLGAEAALEARIEIGKLCRKSVVLVAGLGGGTGTGAGPVVARIAKAHRCEVTAVVTMPFRFEGQRRNQTAEMGWEKFAVDRLVTVPLEDMLPVLERSISLNYGFGIWSIVVAKAVELLPLLDTTLGPENSEVVDVRAMLALVNRATEQSGASTY